MLLWIYTDAAPGSEQPTKNAVTESYLKPWSSCYKRSPATQRFVVGFFAMRSCGFYTWGLITRKSYDYYLRQVNEVNGGDNVFVRCVCFCVSVRSGRSWELNANSSKTVKAMDFKFDTRISRDSPDMTPKIFSNGGVAMVTWPPKFLGVKS